jgi:hypothetical protein
MKTETLTITFSKKFANSAREVAYLFADEKEDLGKTIENMCDAYFEQLVKNDGCELNYEIEDRFWKIPVQDCGRPSCSKSEHVLRPLRPSSSPRNKRPMGHCRYSVQSTV